MVIGLGRGFGLILIISSWDVGFDLVAFGVEAVRVSHTCMGTGIASIEGVFVRGLEWSIVGHIRIYM
jgi:hypothetical protein